ncbi:hypothetical protein CR513_04908, partial [Mucuna pruriens]
MAHCQHLDRDEVDDKPWYHDIKEYLRKVLYKRSMDLTLFHCVDDQEAKEIIAEVHEGIFGTHTNGHALAQKILKVGYYWTKMELGCFQHVKRCLKCQVYADNIHVASSALHNLTSPWPFSM